LSRYWLMVAQLAELELQALEPSSALARIDEALALARRAERRCDLPFAHLLRGEILLKCDPANPAPAEEAFQTALAIAKEQGARSWGLRTALSLAKLYQSTGRPVEAHAVAVGQDHVALASRLFALCGLIQPFQQPERVIGFFDAYRHLYPVSRGTLHGIADRFQQWGAVPRHAAGQGVSELALQTANTCSILFFGGDCIKNA